MKKRKEREPIIRTNSFEKPLNIYQLFTDSEHAHEDLTQIEFKRKLISILNTVDFLLISEDHENALLQLKILFEIYHNSIYKAHYNYFEYQGLLKLAEIYSNHKGLTGCYQASAIYEYLRKIINKGSASKLEERNDFLDFKITELISKTINNNFEVCTIKLEIEANKGFLINCRNEIKVQLKELPSISNSPELNEDEILKRTRAIEEIYKKIKENLLGNKGLIYKIISDCYKKIGPAPYDCKFCFVGLGSASLDTMTLWSDCENMFIIEDGFQGKELDEIKNYLRQLSVLFLIKLNSLGEMPLRLVGIPELNDFTQNDTGIGSFYDKYTDNGLCPDGPHRQSCKTPLGRSGHKGHNDYELIGTVNELMKFQEDEWFKSDPILSYTLLHAEYIYGDQTLLAQYNKAITTRINKSSLILPNGSVVQERTLFMLNRYLKQFSPSINDPFKEGSSFNVKEVYRFPDRMLVCIGNYLNISFNSLWKLTNQLEEFGFSKGACKNLKVMLSIAAELRLLAYSSLNSQQECLIATESNIFKINEPKKVFFLREKQGLLFRFYYTALPLYEFLNSNFTSKFAKLRNQIGNQEFYSYNPTVKANVCRRLTNYTDVILFYNEALRNLQNTPYEKCKLHISMGEVYHKLGQYDLAFKEFMEAEKLSAFLLSPETPKITVSIIQNLALIKVAKAEYADAIKDLIHCLHENKKIYGEDSFSYLETSMLLAQTYYLNNNFYTALDNLLAIKPLLEKQFGVKNPLMASFYNDLGKIYKAADNIQEALKCFKSALQISRSNLGHLHIIYGISLSNLGDIFKTQRHYYTAIKCFTEAAEIYELAYGKDHPIAGALFMYIGECYFAVNDLITAGNFYNKSFQIMQNKLCKDDPLLINITNLLGDFYLKTNNENKALFHFNKSLQIICNSPSPDYPLLSTISQKIAKIYFMNKDYQNALYKYREAYSFKLNTSGFAPKDLVYLLYKIGQTYKALGYYEKAYYYFDSAYKPSKDYNHLTLKIFNARKDTIDLIEKTCTKKEVEAIKERSCAEVKWILDPKNFYIIIHHITPDEGIQEDEIEQGNTLSQDPHVADTERSDKQIRYILSLIGSKKQVSESEYLQLTEYLTKTKDLSKDKIRICDYSRFKLEVNIINELLNFRDNFECDLNYFVCYLLIKFELLHNKRDEALRHLEDFRILANRDKDGTAYYFIGSIYQELKYHNQANIYLVEGKKMISKPEESLTSSLSLSQS